MFDAGTQVHSLPVLRGVLRRHGPPADRPRPRRHVSFSALSCLCRYRPGEGDASLSLWYTEADKARFETEASLDAQRLCAVLAAPRPQDFSPQDAYLCVGIEQLLASPEKTKRRRKRHIRFIVAAQGRCTADELGLLSSHSSRSSSDRAAKLADEYRRLNF